MVLLEATSAQGVGIYAWPQSGGIRGPGSLCSGDGGMG